jgi:hypothetical protein
MAEPSKKPAIDIDEVAGKRLSEISAAEFLQALQQMGTVGAAATADLTVEDVLAGRLPIGGWPEKKKVEREKWPLEKFAPEKYHEQLPEKKKLELEKQQLEGFPEKKKVELEKLPIEKQSLEGPGGMELTSLSDRLTAIEEQLAKLSR